MLGVKGEQNGRKYTERTGELRVKYPEVNKVQR